MAITIPTAQQLYNAGKAEIQARNPSLNDWDAGSVLDAYVGGTIVIADEVLRYSIDRFDALFLDRAIGTDLDALVTDRFGFSRHPATPSSVALSLARNGFAGTITIPAGHPIKATLADGSTVLFTTDTSISHLSGDAGPWVNDVVVTSSSTGRSQNVPLTGTTWAWTTITGTSLTSTTSTIETMLTNAAGGGEIESDAAFRSRAKLYYSTLVRGTASALRTGALSIPEVRYATVLEVVASHNVDTYLYIADATGSSGGTMVADVLAIIDDWRAAGRAVFVAGAAIENPALTLTVKIRAGVDLAAVQSRIVEAVIAYFDTTDPGSVVYLSEVETIIHEVDSQILSADVTVDAAPSSRELSPTLSPNTLRVSAGDLTVAITAVP